MIRLFFVTCFLLTSVCSVIPADVLFTPAELRVMQEAIQRDSEEASEFRRHLRHVAGEWMTQGPWSVTDHPSPAASGDAHDYFSEGPYWWPDPENPEGPYIRRDGERNPDRFEHHHQDINRMMQAVSILSLAGWALDEPRYSHRAAELLQVWCVDPDTRMNPHMEYAQAIRGRTTGRGIGIIDIRRSVEAMQGLAFLARSGEWDSEQEMSVRKWWDNLLTWLTTSEKGLDEKHHYNNHAVWWTAQVAAMALFLERDAIRDDAFAYTHEVIIPNQIAEDGSMPYELKRTLSLNYTVMNTNGFACIARMAKNHGLDVWHMNTLDEITLRRAVEFTVNALRTPDAWTYPQIKPFGHSRQVFLLLAGVDCNEPGWIELNDTFPNREDAIGLYMDAYRITLHP